jgi:CubicO group peptidase (beta-lactamase class C family)
MAYEDGFISIDDYIYDIDNSFKNLDNIRVIDLLSHNQDIWTIGYLGDAKDKDDFYRILYSSYVKSNDPTYEDVHYIILGVLLEKIYNKSYEELCETKIFNVLGMKNTTFNPNSDICASNNYEGVVDYIYPGLIHDNKARKAKEMGINLGHASIFMTGSDLLLFLKSFLDYSLLKKETIKLMLGHRDINKENFDRLKGMYNSDDINYMYDKLASYNKLPLTYNNMGVRYRNIIDKLNDVPDDASDNSVSFSGYTGPMFTIDFDNKVIVIIMCNVIHNSTLDRYERKEMTFEIMNMIFKKIKKELN